jgi:hypothetical protein
VAEKWYTDHFQPPLIINRLTIFEKEFGTQQFLCNKKRGKKQLFDAMRNEEL